jgi:hypothetical protein
LKRLPYLTVRIQTREQVVWLAGAAYSPTMNDTPNPTLSQKQPDDGSSELAPPGTPPHVAVAPGVLDQEHVVIRAADDSDEDYEARRRVFAAALKFARKG